MPNAIATNTNIQNWASMPVFSGLTGVNVVNIDPWVWDTGAYYGDLPERGPTIALRKDVAKALQKSLKTEKKSWKQALAWEQLAHEYTHSLGFQHYGESFGGGAAYERRTLRNMKELLAESMLSSGYQRWLLNKARQLQ